MKNIVVFFIPVLFLISSCEKEDVSTTECDKQVVVNDSLYEHGPSDHLTVLETEIRGDCLRIRFGAGGCDGKSWQVELVASEVEYFSIPPQRDVRLALKDDEMCEAYIVQDWTFDVSELRSSGETVLLNIQNADTSVLYQH